MNGYTAQLCFNKIIDDTNKYDRFSYGCMSFSKVIFELDSKGTSHLGTSDWSSIFISIYAGSENVCNRIPALYLAERWQIEEGTGVINAGAAGSELLFAVDCGSWMLDKGAELYVAIDFPGATTAKNIEATIHAIVNDMSAPNPLRLQYRNDGAFLLEGCSDITIHASGLDERSDTVEISYGSETISQYVSGCCALSNINSVGDQKVTATGEVYSGVPRDIQVNTTMTAGSFGFVAEQSVPVVPKMINLARSFARAKMASIRPDEQKYLRGRG